MILPYISLILAMIFMHAHCGRGWSHDMSLTSAGLPPKAAAFCTVGLRRENSMAPAPARTTKQATPNANDEPRAKVAVLEPASNRAVDFNARTMRQQVIAATEVAERVSAAMVVSGPKQQVTDIDRPARPKTARPGDAEKTSPQSPNTANPLVALLMTRPDIKSVSDLTGKNIAVDESQSALKDNARAAIAEAGAAEFKLSRGQTRAIDRLIGGKVPAAVLALVSPEAAEGFPEIAGFKIFRILVPPRSSKAPPNTP